MHSLSKARGFWCHGSRHAEHIDQEVNQQSGRDEVKHDCGDHHMAAAFGLQPCRDKRPNRAKGGGG